MDTLKHKTTSSWIILLSLILTIAGFGIGALLLFDMLYKGHIYPRVTVGGIPFGGKTPDVLTDYWLQRSEPFQNATFEFRFESFVATVSGAQLNLGYDATLSATQAHLVGRTGHLWTDLRVKLRRTPLELAPLFRWDTAPINDLLETLSQAIHIPDVEPLFAFTDGRVSAFKAAKPGRALNIEESIKRFEDSLSQIPTNSTTRIVIPLAVNIIYPETTTEKVNNFGIRERIGHGYSEFHGSIPGRIHNVALAASRLHGVLIPPGTTLSFNGLLGDVSGSTGYQQAYIIKSGRTVLGDGGGVCQVSTTLFRAALDAGLPIDERQGHAYRVHYYEEGGYKAGLDATVFAPSVDLKISNDTLAHILIQTKTDKKNLTLTIDLYGASDGRISHISNHVVWGSTPPPEPLYQDDPTLPAGTVKQVDFAAWGAKASFDYRVERTGETLIDTKFFTNYRPWQAVFLKGTGTQ